MLMIFFLIYSQLLVIVIVKIVGRKSKQHAWQYLFKSVFGIVHVGKQCQVNINECASSPCQNEGICLDKINSYQCRCQTGYNDTNCQNKIDWCAVNQCSENSNCTSGLSTYTCECFQGRRVSTFVTCSHYWLRTTQLFYLVCPPEIILADGKTDSRYFSFHIFSLQIHQTNKPT